ncbi:MAG: hypothetical protein ACLQIB_14115 [Isosphaeraceae bacterium]
MNENPVAGVAPGPSWVFAELRLWLVSLALFAPALVPYAAHFAYQMPGRQPTGFIDYDMPYYMANARQHFDTGHFRFFYSNPYNAFDASPSVYFQPMTLVLGTLMHWTGIAPNQLFLIFEVLAGWVCARVGVALYAEIVGLSDWARRLGLVVFFWGAGLMVIAGVVYSLAKTGVVEHLFILDPFNGWWHLNFGRNMVYPTEALYHALFFGCILSVLRRSYWLAAFLALIVSWSHPFTGIELALILASWSALELFFVQSGAVPSGFFLASLLVLVVHFGYHLVFLRRFPAHRALMKAWAHPYLLQVRTFAPAYALVGALAVWPIRRLRLARVFFADARNRLFLVWFVVAFALANHEFAIDPIQPLHFARGYIWTSLFFIGSSTLIGLLTCLRRWGGAVAGSLAVGLVVAVFLMDNALWLGSFVWDAALGHQQKYWSVTADQLALYRWMSQPENKGALVLTSDPHDVGFLTAVYTPLRPWFGHFDTTPDIDARRQEVGEFLKTGRVIDEWRGKSLLVTLDGPVPTPRWLSETGAQPVYQNPTYRVYRVHPAAKSPDRSP